MRRISAVLFGVIPIATAIVACGSKDRPPAQAPASSSQPAYGPPGQPGQPQGGQPPGQPGQPQGGQPPGQPGQPQPGQPGQPPAPGQLATPGPTALPCQTDAQCLFHHCNTQYGKCAFPCVSDADCIQGTTCFVAAGPAAACLPKPPGSS